jgi:ferrous iron transport protein B
VRPRERHDGVELRVVDLPGTYSLTANSLEERIARDFILQERPDVVVMIANAAAIERNLYLLAELLCLAAPIVLGINMMDVAAAEGIEIEAHVLSAALGMVVVPMVASRAEGVSTLLTEAARLAQNPAGFNPARSEIGAAHREVRSRNQRNQRSPYPSEGALKRKITELARSWNPDGNWHKTSAWSRFP